MNGHVRKRGSKWEVVLELGEQAAQRCPACIDGRGRSRRYWVADGMIETCPTCGGVLQEVRARRQDLLPERYSRKADAEKAMHAEIRRRERGDYVPPVELTVQEYLETRWLPALGAEDLSPATLGIYAQHIKRIVPLIGMVPLQRLTHNDVAVMAARMATEPSEKTGKPLSAATRNGVLIVLSRALGDAVEAGLLRANPAAKVKRPTVRRPEMHTWTAAELATFLHSTQDDRLGPLWHLLALTGLRRGEALGLRWSDVDFDRGRLALQRQRALAGGYAVQERPTKTGKPRAVALDAETIAALRRQAQWQLDDAAKWKEAYSTDGHVFTREDGAPWHPDRVRVLFQEAVQTAGVPRIRLHDLRHTWATLALRAGVHVKVVQERLGHANVRITLDAYSHVLPDLQESAAELVASVVAAEKAALRDKP